MKRLLSILIVCALALSTQAGVRRNFGPCTNVAILLPTSTTSNDFTIFPSGTAHAAVDETEWAFDDAATYLEHAANSTARRAVFGMSNDSGYAAAGAVIRYVTVGVRHIRLSGTALATRVGLRMSSTDHQIISVNSSGGWTGATGNSAAARKTLNPATSTAWTSAAVDGIEVYLDLPSSATVGVRVTQVYAAVCYDSEATSTIYQQRSGGGD